MGVISVALFATAAQFAQSDRTSAKAPSLRDDPWRAPGAGPVAQANPFLYKGRKIEDRDGQ